MLTMCALQMFVLLLLPTLQIGLNDNDDDGDDEGNQCKTN